MIGVIMGPLPNRSTLKQHTTRSSAAWIAAGGAYSIKHPNGERYKEGWERITRGWYGRLLLDSINSFDQLTREFKVNFVASARPKPTTTSLLGMNRILLGPTARTPKEEDGKSQIGCSLAPNILVNSTRIKIFLQIREKGLLKTPNSMRTRAEEHDRGCYYRFHRDYGHNTEECYDLKNQIEDLIRRGHLDRFVRKSCEPSLR
ncbi:hypothetical protein B296_00003997 [Ensete ventricosum]|uniref:Retrotransposon gag domain-containing protein n=1 Tax=Ensete ventricosum TaxID=4639 RepID=A0A426ZSS2_ENSVE|nr:hypothetical protein B296_00003997 [Ensete ventricosum]